MNRFRRGTDAGNTLIVAVMVGFIAMALSATAIAVVVGTSRDSGRDRQRTSQVHAAEAGIDNAYYLLQAGQLPCTTDTRLQLTDLGDSPDDTVVDTSIRYFDADGSPFDPSLCPLPAGAVPSSAVITATATSTNSVGPGRAVSRTLESQVSLSPETGAYGYAIYVDGALTLPNSFSLTGDGVAAPDIYARSGFVCENTATGGGSVIVPEGEVSLGNSCDVGGDVHSRDQVTMRNGSIVRGNVWVSRSGLDIANPARVLGAARTSGDIVGAVSQIEGTVQSNLTGPDEVTWPTLPDVFDPVPQAMPYVGYEPDAWAAAGFSIAGAASCSEIREQMFEATTPTVFYGDCRLDLSKVNNLTLKTDVAVFVTGGLSTAQQFELRSDDTSATRKLWLIVPAGNGPEPSGWTSASCPVGGDIDMSQKTTIEPSISTFLYTCGGVVDIGQQTTVSGQLYASDASIGQKFTMTFVGLPPVGVDLRAHSASMGYDVGVIYKRETLP